MRGKYLYSVSAKKIKYALFKIGSDGKMGLTVTYSLRIFSRVTVCTEVNVLILRTYSMMRSKYY